ncbi:MAG: hypothetical protein WD607_02410 [Candidatus Paceibacterota bacterium]
MLRFTCFIDASSYINLSLEEYSSGTLLDLLHDLVNIKYSPEVYGEIDRHKNQNMPSLQVRINKVYRSKKFDYDSFHDTFFLNSAPQNDKGEKENLIYLVDKYIDNKVKGLVYLSDDEKAINNILSNAINSFPIFQVWSSFDVVLYLYIDHKQITKDIAESAIRDLNANMATDDERMDHEKTQKRVEIFRKYINRLNFIHNILEKK